VVNLALPITYAADTPEMKRIESEEFRSMLLTCLLAGELNTDRPNTAVRRACGHMLKRFQGERTRKILVGAMSQALPLAYIHRLIKIVESECGVK
jgi:hypothetical protein